ncbi:MAG: hypothetical protein AAB471_00270 [Patescibacteria group bacterium]
MFLVAKTPTPEARNEMPYALSGPLRKIIKVVFVALIALVIIVYSYFQTKNLINGPGITILSPANGSVLTDSLITLEGTTKNISKISVNDRPILIDQKGNFREQLVVPLGYTIISVKGIDRFGKEKEATLEIVRKK